MKAQTFLEWSKNKPSLDYYGGSIFDIVDFYSQPFKPELITELFEGWERHKNIENTPIDWWHEPTNSNYPVPQYEFEYQGDGVIYTGCGGKYIVATMPPKTLNDFISDCQRAGIELTWKPEIERKYFV